jgi:hypothetical protein
MNARAKNSFLISFGTAKNYQTFSLLPLRRKLHKKYCERQQTSEKKSEYFKVLSNSSVKHKIACCFFMKYSLLY